MISMPPSRISRPPKLVQPKQAAQQQSSQQSSSTKLALNLLIYALSQNNVIFPIEDSQKYLKLFQDFITTPDDLDLPFDFNVIKLKNPFTTDHFEVHQNGILIKKLFFIEIKQPTVIKQQQLSTPKKPLSPCQTRPKSSTNLPPAPCPYMPQLYKISSGEFNYPEKLSQKLSIYAFSQINFTFSQIAEIEKFDVECDATDNQSEALNAKGEIINFVDEDGVGVENRNYCGIGEMGEMCNVNTVVLNILRAFQINFVTSEEMEIDLYASNYELKNSYLENSFYSLQLPKMDFLVLDFDQLLYNTVKMGFFGPQSHARLLTLQQECFLSISKKETRIPGVVSELFSMLNSFTKSGLNENFSYGVVEISEELHLDEIISVDQDFGDLRFDLKRLVKECVDAIENVFSNKKVEKLYVYGSMMNFELVRNKLFEHCEDIEIIQ